MLSWTQHLCNTTSEWQIYQLFYTLSYSYALALLTNWWLLLLLTQDRRIMLIDVNAVNAMKQATKSGLTGAWLSFQIRSSPDSTQVTKELKLQIQAKLSYSTNFIGTTWKGHSYVRRLGMLVMYSFWGSHLAAQIKSGNSIECMWLDQQYSKFDTQLKNITSKSWGLILSNSQAERQVLLL